FEQRGVLSDLDEAIELHRVALALCPPGHSNRSDSLNNLAVDLLSRFKQHVQSSDLNEAFTLYGQLSQVSRSVLHGDLQAAKSWIVEAEKLKHSSALAAYQIALEFLSDWQHVTGLSSSSNHFDVVSKATSSLAMDAFSCGIRYGALETAVVLVEQGRAVFWTKLAHFQTPLDELSASGDVGKALAVEFKEASLRLRAMSEASSEDKTSQIGQLTRQQDDVISRIRMLPDFSRFLLPPLFSDLQHAAENGPVIIVNSSRYSSDAMIILSVADPVHVPLHIAQADVLELSKKFQSLTEDAGSSDNQLYEIVGVLRTLWECVVNPIVDALKHLAQPGSRIWWCPTAEFALLPLHAAGPYARRSYNFSDLFISSYTPTLAALIRARQQVAQDATTSPHFVAIGQGNPDKGKVLLRVAAEVDDVARRVTSILPFTLLMESDATVQRALDALNRHQWSWIVEAEKLKHSSALAAYQIALEFLSDWQHVTGLSSSSNHFDVVSKATSSLAMDAFSCGIRYGALETAVVLVEQGRAVFWTKLAHFQTPLDDLSASGDVGKALAVEFKEASLRLRAMSEASSSEAKTSQIGQLTIQQDGVISRIRMLPDFSRFLLPPLFSDLQHAAENGPVIIVNSSRYSSDAMIILSVADPVHVPLHIAQADVLELSKKFQSLTEDAGSSDNQLYEIVGVLRTLWECVVNPIVDALKHLAQPGSRIWWCPTAEFALLPLHAAGPYARRSYNFSDLFISSYTPTLAALIRARQQVAQDATTSPHFVAIGQGNPDKGKVLLRVAAEVDDVARRVTSILPFTLLMESDATVQRALDALNRHQWVHLACHGMPNRKKPFESSFTMRDGPLTITDIIRPRLHTPEFAFLSACHTTVGYESSPDESIHLAAAMQFSGFRSVIGSMWSVDDEVVGQIVSAFYDNMVDESGKLDCRRAAIALHKAVKTLRKTIPLEQQIVLVHIGV
ncbi:hypothetical protein M405DRAFT_917267, partial [Rhizopogon salebrosus TDB-379]